jgi:hypothetical protein
VVAVAGICRWLHTLKADDLPAAPSSQWTTWITGTAGIAVLTLQAHRYTVFYGGWDAWSIWNYHALFLAHPSWWKQMFAHGGSHPDYPLLLPSLVAFWWRLFATQSTVWPFIVGYLYCLMTPVLLFLALRPKSLPMAGLVLFLFATDEFYLTQGVSQYADHILGFYLLCALVCFRNAAGAQEQKLIALAAACCGCMLWTKNEGALLCLVTAVFYMPLILRKGNLKFFLAGILLPLIVLLLFKGFYAPSNDLVAGNRGADLLAKLTSPGRYGLIFTHLKAVFQKNLPEMGYGMLAYLACCLLQRRAPDRAMWLLLTCLAGYIGVYLITPNDLEWHLTTSADRLMLQLFPAFAYVAGLRLAGGLRLSSRARP